MRDGLDVVVVESVRLVMQEVVVAVDRLPGRGTLFEAKGAVTYLAAESCTHFDGIDAIPPKHGYKATWRGV